MAIPAWLLPVQREMLIDRIGELRGAPQRALLNAVAEDHGGGS
jgi:hypothetical protein